MPNIPKTTGSPGCSGYRSGLCRRSFCNLRSFRSLALCHFSKFRIKPALRRADPGMFSLPLIVTVSEQAFLAVPQDYRDASYALGATKCQTILKVVLPSAASTIITGTILSNRKGSGGDGSDHVHGAAFFALRKWLRASSVR